MRDLGAVLEITGGVAAVSIGFLVPAILHFKMTPEINWIMWRNKPSKRWLACKTFAASYFILIVGSFAMFFTIVAMIDEFGSGEGEAHDAFDESIPGQSIDAHGLAVHTGTTPGSSNYYVEPWRRMAVVVVRRALRVMA